MRVAIYGAGAMGTILGAYIAASGKQIDLITRNKAHVEAMKQHGARVLGHADFTVHVNAYTPDEMSGVYDIIFLMTKQRDNPKILATLRDFLATDGVICTMQNGRPEPSVINAVGQKRCLGCAVSWGAKSVGFGEVELSSNKEKMTFALGSMHGYNKWIDTVKEYLECAGKVTVEENFFGARWAKLVLNSAFSPLSALTGMKFGDVAKGKYTKRLALALMNEAFSVAEQCGVEIAPIQGHDIVATFKCQGGIKSKIALRLLPIAMRNHKDLVSGMYADLKAGKKCEVEFVNGIIQKLGSKFGVETPVNNAVIGYISEIENGKRFISPDNAKQIYKKVFKK